jgi:ABC-type molybdate transport system substrate-binding protein
MQETRHGTSRGSVRLSTTILTPPYGSLSLPRHAPACDIKRLGIAEQVKAKARVPAGGIVGEFVARGEAELGIQQISEVRAVPGVELAGPLPPEIQKMTVFSAGIRAGAQHAEEARAFVDFLTSS